jgi:apolipoprotein D and lipocalin family protein
MFASIISVYFAVVSLVNAQVPGFGRCPEYEAMSNFDAEKFLGRWIEIERYFSVSEVISRCIVADYERRADGNVYVKNYYTNRM